VWAYPGTAQIFWVPPITSGTGKATDCKLGQCIQRVHPNKSPLKFLEKRERERIQGLPNFFQVPPIISGTGKLRISNLASTFRGSIRTKAHQTFWRKGSVGVSRDCQNVLGTPYYLRNGKSYGFQIWPVHLEGPSEEKPILEKRERGHIQGLPNFFRIPPIISGAGKATNFQFCMYIYRLNRNKSPLKILRKVAMSVVRDSRKFSGHPYIGRIARSSLRQLSFLVSSLHNIKIRFQIVST